MFTAREYVELGGGLISYGPSVDDLVRRAVIYVDRVLKDARPSDLSVEHPTRFELTINLKTSKALDLDISAALIICCSA
jgi:putative ABC transport system substrate-binding protein